MVYLETATLVYFIQKSAEKFDQLKIQSNDSTQFIQGGANYKASCQYYDSDSKVLIWKFCLHKASIMQQKNKRSSQHKWPQEKQSNENYYTEIQIGPEEIRCKKNAKILRPYYHLGQQARVIFYSKNQFRFAVPSLTMGNLVFEIQAKLLKNRVLPQNRHLRIIIPVYNEQWPLYKGY
ncbi:hypothetical protein FGO68_gene7087 [Halteria grandinella]|uniref:Uncharacterized protein n=1 Tax=Halteria grandinella TaxID=5974 RepID=A0A8J8SXM3_HALGN|nr:hypothetical protein FGO68_gene7087 [Halteria grandinella]